ncbi:MAG: heavy metal translocating P-type ATPase [Melioribacteraceae bacterium]|nr:heavy metal translocating P-type ATPase [Melioribacteraceae bacterium]
MKKYQLKNMDCASCAAKIETGLSKMPEVKFVNVNFANSSLTIDTNNFETVKRKINELEPEVEIADSDNTQKFVTKNEIIENKWTIIKALSAIIILAAGLLFGDELHNSQYWIVEYIIYIAAYLISGWGVLTSAFRNIFKGRVFDEQFLMTIATLGAFAIHEMAEGVAVMLFYVIGELFQDISVNRSRKSIKSLLEIKPDYANLVVSSKNSESEIKKVSPDDVKIDDIIIVKPVKKFRLTVK